MCARVHTTLAHLHGVCVTFLSQHTADDVRKEEESQLVVVFESQSTHIKDPPCLLLENLSQHTQQDSTTLQHTQQDSTTLQHTQQDSTTLQHTQQDSTTLQHTQQDSTTLQHTQQDSTTLQQSAGEARTRESITETVSGDCACFVCDYSKVVGACVCMCVCACVCVVCVHVCVVCVWCVCDVCACVYIRGTLTFPIMWFNQCVIQSFEVSTLLGRYIGIFLACSVEPCVVYCERR